MKSSRSQLHRSGGYALMTVMIFLAIMAILTASMLKYSGTERRLNERSRLLLRARNMAENAALYASEQLTTKLYRLRNASPMAFMSGSNQIYLPPDDVLTTSFSTPSDVEVRAGLTTSTGLLYIDPNDSANANNPNAGLSVSTSTVPIIAKATMRHPSLGAVTAYAQQDLQIAMIPLFQFAVFYNMDMEFGPGPNMIISGPVHTNGNLIARIQTGFANTLQFTERVTAAGGLYADTAYKGKTYMGDGSVDAGPGGTGPLYFQSPSGTVTNIKSSSTWRDHKYGTATESTTTRNQFKTFATSTYAGNLRTSVHGVTALQLPSIGGYQETDDPLTTEDDTKNGRQLIEASDPDDTADLIQAKFARRSGLYIVVNPDDTERTGRLPDGTDVAMRARSYRCFLNTVNTDGTHTTVEVILPGQPSYGALNANINKLPNAYRTDTSVGHNQVLRIPFGDFADTGYAGPAIPTYSTRTDAYFYDLRRGDGSNGYPFNRPSNNFIPRPIAKVDFDLTRFKMAVERTMLDATSSTVFNPAPPSDANWSNSIYNASATAAAHGLGLGADYTSVSGSGITIRGYERPGNGVVKTYDARWVIAESTDGSTYVDRYTSAADEASVNFTITTGTTHLRIRMYYEGAAPGTPADGWQSTTTRMLDEQIVRIGSVDGVTTTTLATLSNEYHVIAISASGSIPSAHLAEAYSDMRVYVGGVDDTANWTFSATGASGLSGAFGTGAFKNRYQISSVSSDYGSVTLRATKGTTILTKTFRIEKQSAKTAYNTPAQRTRWIGFGAGTDYVRAGVGGDPFKIYFAPADPNDSRIVDNPDAFEVTASNLVSTTTTSPWFDGITIYVHSVDAEVKTRTSGVLDRVDSGVRLWNGRGAVISLSSASYPGRTGFAFATNDAAYIVGHFNADGTINATSSSTGTGGYSGRYPESASEMLCAVMGDAITLLSQPLYTQSGSNYYQTTGWADSLSAHRRSSGGWSSSWSSANPSGSNSVDGISTAEKPAALPNLSDIVLNPGTAPSTSTTKLAPSVTEISTCLLTGIVRTTSAQTSGGVHNFPRLLENWAGTGLYIRGSMVAMFESQVATEPWSIRYYQGAGRYWGLHQNLRAENGAHDLPLEPIVLNGQRMRYRELTPTEYTAQKAVIEALPH